MKLTKENIGNTYEISEILRGVPCQNCPTCIKLRLMEMGLDSGEKIEVEGYRHGLLILNILSRNGYPTSKMALREEEFQRICVL